uniref:Uncharacterized protein n=1 Tax=Meloidogyne enterolobii TaxID=390850 RepID=A0A6V7WPT9_MELEN|nr:unnamed protein product [Meloidogyne enterolobii]
MVGGLHFCLKKRENADVCPFKWKRIKKEEKRMKRIFKRKKSEYILNATKKNFLHKGREGR